MTAVAIALGSNLGDREATLTRAVDRLRALLAEVRVSSWHETEPVGAPPPPFLNGALVGHTTLTARALLARLQQIESDAGRERPFPNAPRTLDLDLILYGNHIVDEPGLRIPHPRFRARRFVLEPLAEIAAEWQDPTTGKSVGQLLGELASG